ncbi:MAG: hypothetical protein ACO3UU_14460, partial [Minisyncoccia bacterium]
EIIPYFFKGIPSDVAFEISNDNDWEIMQKDFSKQNEDIYKYGARNISSNKYYSGEELIPYAFLLYRNPGSSFEEGLINRRIKEIDLWNQAEEMSKNITAIKDTFLKKSTAQSSDLSPEDILDVELGKTYPIEKIIGTENGHKKIELGYGAESGIYGLHIGMNGRLSNPKPMKKFFQIPMRRIGEISLISIV